MQQPMINRSSTRQDFEQQKYSFFESQGYSIDLCHYPPASVFVARFLDGISVFGLSLSMPRIYGKLIAISLRYIDIYIYICSICMFDYVCVWDKTTQAYYVCCTMYIHVYIYIYMCCIYIYMCNTITYSYIPVVPHKAVAEVSKIGNL